jgi:Ca2+-binding EF-hand superfamily protein
MNQTTTRILTLCLFTCFLTSSALADKANGPKAKFFAKYDKNKNGKIDADEKEAIRKDFAADPEGDLKRFDKNKNGKLDDDEIAAIKPPEGKKKGEKSDKTKKSDETTKSDKPAPKAEKSDAADKTDKTEKK